MGGIIEFVTTSPAEEFTHPDRMHLDAAEGWLGLGDHISAEEELEKVSPSARLKPQALLLRWGVYCAAKTWPLAAEVAKAITFAAPHDQRGWLHYSYALHEMKRTADARNNLLDVIDHFPGYALMRYNLACYESQLGNLDQARKHLEHSFTLEGGSELRADSLTDPDLAPLWKKR